MKKIYYERIIKTLLLFVHPSVLKRPWEQVSLSYCSCLRLQQAGQSPDQRSRHGPRLTQGQRTGGVDWEQSSTDCWCILHKQSSVEEEWPAEATATKMPSFAFSRGVPCIGRLTMRNHCCHCFVCSSFHCCKAGSVLTLPRCSQHFYTVMSRGLFFVPQLSTVGFRMKSVYATFVVSQNRRSCFVSLAKAVVTLVLQTVVGQPGIIHFHWETELNLAMVTSMTGSVGNVGICQLFSRHPPSIFQAG